MKSVFSLLGCLIIYTSSAQLPIVFRETFDTNDLGWWVGQQGDYSMRMEDGKYVIATTTKSVGRYSAISATVNSKADFVLEASFTQKSGSTNHGFGLLWGDVSGGRHHEFIIASSGNFKIRSTVPGENINQWISTKVNPIGEVNQLRIEVYQHEWHYFINGEKVKTEAALTIHGSQLGIIAYTDMQLEVDNYTLRQDMGIKLPPDLDIGYVKENMGSHINSPYDDVGPHVTADGNTILYGVKNSPENVGGVQDGEDVWVTTSHDGLEWSKSRNMGISVNDVGTNNLASISADNNTLLFCTEGGFLIRKRTTTGWSSPGRLNLNFINEADNMEANLAPDGRAILFTAKFKENLHYKVEEGEKDIYVVVQRKDGSWSSPINLGAQINTHLDEISPFLAADGRTLYFGTNGRPGYGSYDVYMSKRLGNDWTSWSEPINLGHEINGPGFDAYFTMSASADYAYMVSNRNSIGRSDLVRIKVPEAIKPKPVILFVGRTFDARTRKPLVANLVIQNSETKQRISSSLSDPSTGTFRMVLDNGHYDIHAGTDGYLSVNENLGLQKITKYTEIKKDLYLEPIIEDELIELSNVFFHQGKAILKPVSYQELDRLVEIMNENPSMKIELSGHTDNIGSKKSLMKLSQDRVEAVKNYMVKKGVKNDRIVGKGYGPTQPLVLNDTVENRERNRRVEFRIIKR